MSSIFRHCFLSAFLIATVPAAKGVVAYTDPPAWWDDCRVIITDDHKALKNAEEFWDAVSKANHIFGTQIEGWEVIGPFEGAEKNSLDIKYDPQKSFLKIPYIGKDNEKVEWTTWPPGEANPLADNIQNAIFYAYRTMHVKEPWAADLRIQADDSIRITVNGHKAYTGVNIKGQVIKHKMTFPAGENRIMLKIHQKDGTWGFGLLSITDTLREQIKLRTILCHSYPEQYEMFYQCAHALALHYVSLNDSANASMWIQNMILNSVDGKVLSTEMDKLIKQAPDKMKPIFYYGMEQAYPDIRDDAIKQSVVNSYIHFANANKEPQQIVAFARRKKIALPVDTAKKALTSTLKAGDSALVTSAILTTLGNEADPGKLKTLAECIPSKLADDLRPFVYRALLDTYKGSTRHHAKTVIRDAYVRIALASKERDAVLVFIKKTGASLNSTQSLKMLEDAISHKSPSHIAYWISTLGGAEADRDAIQEMIKVIEPHYKSDFGTSIQSGLLAGHARNRSSEARALLGQSTIEVLLAGDKADIALSFVKKHGLRLDPKNAEKLLKHTIASKNNDDVAFWLEYALNNERDPDHCARLVSAAMTPLEPDVAEGLLSGVVNGHKKAGASIDRIAVAFLMAAYQAGRPDLVVPFFRRTKRLLTPTAATALNASFKKHSVRPSDEELKWVREYCGAKTGAPYKELAATLADAQP